MPQPWLYTVNIYSFTYASQWLSAVLCYWDPQAVAERSSGSYPGHLFIENVFLLLPGTQIRSGDRWGRAALDDTFVPGTDSRVLLCWAWIREWKAALTHWGPVEMRHLGLHRSLSCLIADDLSLRGWLLRMSLAFPTSNTYLSLTR